MRRKKSANPLIASLPRPASADAPRPKKRRESLGPRRAAEVLGVSMTTIYRMIHQGDIPAFRVRKCLRITVANLLAYRRENRVIRRSPITGYWERKLAERQARQVLSRQQDPDAPKAS
jgi:excisionase family DNA binding protein